MRLLIRRKMILITVSSLLNHFTIIVRFIHRSKYLFVPGKRRGVVLLTIESDFNALSIHIVSLSIFRENARSFLFDDANIQPFF